ncbi:hypothetical protein E4U19_006342 [Claviceps sp. Clav32 group G5]|nr:hypothetical protein E4U19_006342 [Claviceps sp. Clav32 group G5]
MKVPLRRTVLDWASALEKGVAFFLQAPTGCGCTGNLMQKLLQAALNTEIQQTEVNGQEAGNRERPPPPNRPHGSSLRRS